jgi:hypothetical protein
LRIVARVALGASEFRMLFGLRLATYAMQTLLTNLRSNDVDQRWFHRAARGNIPESKVQDFQSFVEQQAMAFLSATDDWMSSTAHAGTSGAPTVAHVQVLLTLGQVTA